MGFSLAVLLAQNQDVTAITTTESKADMLNQFISPIQDYEIERFFKEACEGQRKLNIHTTTDKEAAYKSADLVIVTQLKAKPGVGGEIQLTDAISKRMQFMEIHIFFEYSNL